MRLGLRIDRARRQVAEARLEPGRTGLRLAPGLLRRILLWASPLPMLAALSLHLEAPAFTAVLPLGIGAFVVLWQVLAYGSSDGRITAEQLSVTNLYPRGVLIFLAILWTALIAFVCVGLYLKVGRG